MKHPRRSIKIAVAVAAVMLMGITAYAANALNLFSFMQNDKFVTMHTTESMTSQEAQDFVNNNESTSIPDDVQILQPDASMLTFGTVQQAEKEMDMVLVLPASMPAMKLDTASGQILGYGDGYENRIVWLNYSDEQGRIFGVTTSREIVPAGGSITGYTTHDIDPGSLDSYKSKAGDEFTILTESDDTGEKTAHIATIMIGEYEYALVFFGFDEAERQMMIDSADISVYK